MESKPASPVPPASRFLPQLPSVTGLWPRGVRRMNLPTLIVFMVSFTVAEKQENSLKFEASLDYTATPCL